MVLCVVWPKLQDPLGVACEIFKLRSLLLNSSHDITHSSLLKILQYTPITKSKMDRKWRKTKTVISQKWKKIAKTIWYKINSLRSSVLFTVWIKSVAETMWKQYQLKEGFDHFLQSFSQLFKNKKLFPFLCVIFANTILQIITKSHSTPFPIMLHLLMYVSCMCAHSYAPKFGRRKIIILRISMRNNNWDPVCALHIRHTN